jgi:hypothetical protein
MTLAQRSSTAIHTPRSIAFGTLAALVLVAGLVGGLIGGGLAIGLTPAAAAPITANAPASIFDAAAFRAEERLVWPAAPAPTFDAAGFRAGEREPLFP